MTAGEIKVFNFFNHQLSPEWEIYIQPHLNGLRPDFVLLNPNAGIAVFEVKDWNLDAMNYWVEKRENSAPILFAEKDGTRFSLQAENPVEKVYRYKQEIFNLYCPRLKQGPGFAVITAGIIFPFADDARVKDLFTPCLEYRDMRKFPEYNPMAGHSAISGNELRKVFPEGNRKHSVQINQDLIKDLRNWLIEPDASSTQRRPLELDGIQKSFVTSRTESGYRRIRGAAGSGKSLVLAARAAELLGQGKDVLVVTYNITLLHYLIDLAVRWPIPKGKTRSDITWLHFHGWCERVCFENDASSEYENLLLGTDRNHVFNESIPALVDYILQRGGASLKYDAVLIDEGQDFRPSWWNVLRKVCKPNGEMLLVADVTQDVYGAASTWTEEAMIGAGFSGKWAELDISYRMPKLALEKAIDFAQNYLPQASRILPKNNQINLELERCDLRWVKVSPENAAQVCRDEILRIFSSGDHEQYSITDTTFLCDNLALGYEVVECLEQIGILCVHTYDEDYNARKRQKIGFYMGDARVKATTLHSFKGWEARSLVIYMGPSSTPQSLALLYTGLTRIKRHAEGSCLTVVSSSDALLEYGQNWPQFEVIH
jgi:hypothetical protein